MIQRKKYCMAALCLMSAMLISGQHLSYNPKVDEDFKLRQEMIRDKTPFFVFEDGTLVGDRREAMKFLYAYMPLPDIAGHLPSFFLENVDASLKAKEEMPWGKDIPEREFLHFVLPLRVNNEYLDSSRTVFYDELKDRVKNLTIKEAILEANHWCHEKVSYRPSDGRTSSPLSSMSQAIGRCGEESTFTVAALRSIGIPARQVYTTRWAHTDDNHAWVEAYADGDWYFFGACEPEAVLNLGWFNEPASRGVLMRTNVIGKYEGDEELLASDDITTSINITSNYTKVGPINVRVTDEDGVPVEGCKVNFCVYNYADFFPVATKVTDKTGNASVIMGHGDVIVWATDGNRFGFVKANSSNNETAEVVLDKDNGYQGSFELLIVPAPPSANIPFLTAEQKKANDLRLAAEDSIRNAYISTFATERDAMRLAEELNVDSGKLSKILTESRGNHRAITEYLKQLDSGLLDAALNLLLAVTEKDRRDIPINIIEDNLVNTLAYPDSTLWVDYVLNPRIEREQLVPYKAFFRDKFDEKSAEQFRDNPAELVNWVRENIFVDSRWNPQQYKMEPISVWNQREATRQSRNIFFVALARSLGIPARIDPVTNNTQYIDDLGKWTDAIFEVQQQLLSGKGRLYLDYTPTGRITDPIYYTQFSLCKLNDGVPGQLEFEESDRVSTINAQGKELDAGKYMLVSGQRMANGSVLAKGVIFDLVPDTLLHVSLEIPQDNSKIQVIGSLNAENIYHDIALDEDKSLLSTTGRGYYVIGIISPNHEPSVHALNDISSVKNEFEQWGGAVMIMLPTKSEAQRFDSASFANLPSNVHFGVDIDSVIKNELTESLALVDTTLPVFVIADTFNRVVFVSTGYSIGLGDRLLDILSKVNSYE